MLSDRLCCLFKNLLCASDSISYNFLSLVELLNLVFNGLNLVLANMLRFLQNLVAMCLLAQCYVVFHGISLGGLHLRVILRFQLHSTWRVSH